MKKIIFTFLVALLASNIIYSQKNNNIEELGVKIQKISDDQSKIRKEIEQIKKENKEQNDKINDLHTDNKNLITKTATLRIDIDSLNNKQKVFNDEITQLREKQDTDRSSFKNEISTNQAEMNMRTLWGGVLLLVLVIVFIVYLYLRRRKDHTSISEVRKAQDALQVAQQKMQEDSVKLDNQLLDLIDRQMSAVPESALNSTDHSLAIKVADEIVRIELNLSRMDASVKGYKQLSKAVERIKNNFQANGYEIVDMLGQPYNEGMKVVANFVPDENLNKGEQIITGITKPQINYNGKMIQSVQITVSQNI